MARKEYIKGQEIGNAIFIEDVPFIKHPRRALFKCKCGKIFEADVANVKNGQIRSCRCALSERKKPRVVCYCACGCTKELTNIDTKGRNRLFIHGHNKGHNKPHSPETIALLVMKSTGRIYSIESNRKKGSAHVGSKNHNWKGGVTSENDLIRKSNKYKVWRLSVFERDNYTCQMCNEKESVSGKLQADHIKPFAYFPELRFSLDNGRTLCIDCHKTTDTYLVKAKIKYGSRIFK